MQSVPVYPVKQLHVYDALDTGMTQVPLIWQGSGVHGVTEEHKNHFISWNMRTWGN